MTKTLRKVIMHRSKLKNIYNKKQADDYWANYKKQMNFYVNLLRKPKRIISRIQTYRIYPVTENSGKQSSHV